MALQIHINPNEGETSHRRPRRPPTWRKISKVPELLLEEEQNSQDYIPKVVSVGPYHHGKPELRLAESVKPRTLEIAVSGDTEKINLFYQEIKNEIINIRNCYEQEFTCMYSDDQLVRMMLHDASFIMIYIEMMMDMLPFPPSDQVLFVLHTLGMLTMSIAYRDFFLLENQIPLWIVKLLLSSRHGEDGSQDLLNRYLTRAISGEHQPKRSLSLEDKEDLHLLEAFYRFQTFDCVRQPEKTLLSFINYRLFCCKEKAVDPSRNNANPITDRESAKSYRGKSRFQFCVNELKARACKRLIKNENEGDYVETEEREIIDSIRSVNDLKAKGIHFEPSPTPSLKDVQFESYCIYGKLQLPIHGVGAYTKAFFLNMIAYELDPNNQTEYVLISYVNLMKSLIMRSEDIKELREKKILFSILGSDEQVLKVFQDINTHHVTNLTIFKDVTIRIQGHYNSKSKTWIAELIHTYFRNPWTVIALSAATFLLVLTILQTIYTVKS